jgi:hypothetical protein
MDQIGGYYLWNEGFSGMAAKRNHTRSPRRRENVGQVLRHKNGTRVDGFPLPELRVIGTPSWISWRKGLAWVKLGFKGDDSVLCEMKMTRSEKGFSHRDIGEIAYNHR